MKKEIGTLIHRDTLMLRTHVAEADDGEDRYTLEVGASMQPMIRSGQTGHWFLVRWSDLIMLARERGIDDPDSVQRETTEEAA